MKIKIHLIILSLALAGCTTVPEDQRVLAFHSITPSAQSAPSLRLSQGFTFSVPGGHGIWGAMDYTILAGEYIPYGEDINGSYYRHKERGIVRSGNFGIADNGGIFVPMDKTKRWGVWMIPHSEVPIYTMTLHYDTKGTVLYLANIPEEHVKWLNDNGLLK